MIVLLDKYEIPVEVIYKNNKNVYFRFKGDILYVTCSRVISRKEIEKLIYQNQKAIIKMYLRNKEVEDEKKIFTYLGKPYTIVFDKTIKNIIKEDDMLYFKDEKMFNKWYSKECKRVFTERINYWIGEFRNIPEFSLRIRSMKTRWGVNNVTKCIITLNSELLKKDIDLIDYVIIHELCHFYEANHSERFWYQVSLRCPDYKEKRKRLRG